MLALGTRRVRLWAVFTILLPVLLGVMALGVDFALIHFNWSMV